MIQKSDYIPFFLKNKRILLEPSYGNDLRFCFTNQNSLNCLVPDFAVNTAVARNRRKSPIGNVRKVHDCTGSRRSSHLVRVTSQLGGRTNE